MWKEKIYTLFSIKVMKYAPAKGRNETNQNVLQCKHERSEFLKNIRVSQGCAKVLFDIGFKNRVEMLEFPISNQSNYKYLDLEEKYIG